eukprot:scaffold131965_cov18-Tisochrysis_lutea.AAC.1
MTPIPAHKVALRKGQPSILPLTRRRSYLISKTGGKSPSHMAVSFKTMTLYQLLAQVLKPSRDATSE